jgi:polyribonucleotide nucleotidyltransferase
VISKKVFEAFPEEEHDDLGKLIHKYVAKAQKEAIRNLTLMKAYA